MDGIELLKAFAKEQGIDVKEVNNFLNKFNNPQTLDDLLKMPIDMLKHFRWTTDLEGQLAPLKEYIRKTYEPNRMEVITLERVADNILDNICYYKYKLEEGKITQEKFDSETKELREIESQIIMTKFGSVRWDW